MFRVVAIALVAMAAFDWYYLDCKHLHAVEHGGDHVGGANFVVEIEVCSYDDSS
jgi:hypothetical protein